MKDRLLMMFAITIMVVSFNPLVVHAQNEVKDLTIVEIDDKGTIGFGSDIRFEKYEDVVPGDVLTSTVNVRNLTDKRINVNLDRIATNVLYNNIIKVYKDSEKVFEGPYQVFTSYNLDIYKDTEVKIEYIFESTNGNSLQDNSIIIEENWSVKEVLNEIIEDDEAVKTGVDNYLKVLLVVVPIGLAATYFYFKKED